MTLPGPPTLEPLRFVPILKTKVWGGRRLERWGKALPPGASVGESWEVADLDATDPGGGGGEAALSVVRSGAFAGMTLRQLLASRPHDIMGDCSLGATGAFPLLVKFLDAREHLSVQVHPSPAYAAAHPEAHLKTESWLVLEAEAVGGMPPLIFKGLRPGVGQAELLEAIERGRVPDVMHAEAAVPGDCHTLPSGTVHALGAGVLVAEVQTASDTTYRVYDWAREYGRQGRTLHVEQAMANIDFGPAPASRRAHDSGVMASTEFYTMREVRGAVEFADARPAPTIVIGLEDATASAAARPREAADASAGRIARGETVLVPASCAARFDVGRALVVELRAGRA